MKLNKIISAIVALAMCMTVIPNLEKLPSASAEDEVYYDYWEDAYFDVLRDFMNNSKFYHSSSEYGNQCSKYELYDIDENGIPELIISYGDYLEADCYVYTFYDSQLIEFGPMGRSSGKLFVNPDNKYLIYQNSMSGYYSTNCYSLSNGELIKKTYFWDNVTEFNINGNYVSKSKYDSELNKYKGSAVTVGRKSSFDDLYTYYNNVWYSNRFTHACIDYTDTAVVNIPATVNGLLIWEYLYEAFYDNENLQAINVDAQNQDFLSENGILFFKPKTELCVFPQCKSVTQYTIPSTVSIISKAAFYNQKYIKEVTIPKNVEEIYDFAFAMCPNLSTVTILNSDCEIWDYWEEPDPCTISNGYNENTGLYYYNGVIKGYEGSTAQEYAQNYGIKFVSLGADPAKTTTTTTSTTTTTTTTDTTTTTTSIPTRSALGTGDVNGDNIIDSRDASAILREYAASSTKTGGLFTNEQKKAADVNGDNKVDSRDASLILMFYAQSSAWNGEQSIEKFINKYR